MTVDAERELRTTEEQEEDQNSDEDEDEDEDDDGEDKISGKVFCLTGHMSTARQTIAQAILDAGGKVVNSITKEVQVLVASDPDANSAKLDKARKSGMIVVGEDYLQKYLSY